jgi:GGDEF domain-containing protein
VAAYLQSSPSGADESVRRAIAVPSMPEPLNLSQPAWALLDMLQQQLDVSVEVLDSALRPLLPGVGEAASAIDQPAVTAEILKSLRSGEARIDRTSGAPVGIFPLRVARQVAGVLIIARRAPRQPEGQATPDVNIERAGHLARLALESDLALTSQLVEARHRTRRAHGILRFLAQLGTFRGEREVMNAVIQAATVWFDADCRIYERQHDGSFLLAAALPGAEQRPSGARIDKTRAEKLIASRRFSSGGDLEDLGLAGRRAEVLVLPVGDPEPEWLLILAGPIDQEIELTFAAIARVLAAELQSREVSRVDAWQQRLAGIPDDKRRAPERILLKLLEALATEVEAVSARVTLVSGGSERALAALGPPSAPSDSGAPDTSMAAEAPATELTGIVEIAPETSVRISVSTLRPSRASMVQVSSWLKALQPWLREAVASLTSQASLFDVAVEVSSFERRIQEEVERAKRFNLGLGLVLIGGVDTPPGDISFEPVVAAVRSELRASDLMGRIRGGQVAVVLVHAEPIGADSVVGRLRARLGTLAEETTVSAVQLGRATFSADCSSADALIARALQQAQSLELRN